MASVNPFNLSDSEEEAERRPNETVDTERSPSDGAPGPPPGNPFSPPADAEPPTLLLSSNRTSPSGEGISVSAAATSAMAGSADTRVSVDVIAAQLLRDQYVLTALEFHTELLEAGRELPRLRDYFSNPGNFERQSGTPPAKDQDCRKDDNLKCQVYHSLTIHATGTELKDRAGSISTLDSLDFARYSDDGNRESDERVAVLEFELRKAKETIQALRANLTKAAESEVPSQERKNFKSSPEIQDPVRPLEKRALNFLVNEYLLKNEYKLSSITFSDENDDQDFELWDDVGLNIPKPPDLLQLYRNCGTSLPSPRDTADVAVGVDLGNLPGNCIAQDLPKMPDLSLKPITDNGQYLDIQGVQESETKPDPASTQNTSQPHPQTHNKLKSRPPVQFDQPNRKLSPAFLQALLSFCRMCSDSRLGAEVSRIADSEESVMLMLGRCLPHIVPNVLLAKREELIPLILCTACLHPEPKERDQLLHILFNLIKRPDDEQRQMILTGCVAFARHINHKYPERRLLVAESCGALAPYLPKEIRSSLVLSMLQQMLTEDKADMVREAVVKSLGIIMGYIDDPDKYSQQGEHGLDEHKLHVFLSALQSLIPPLFAVVLLNAPFTSRAKLHGDIPAIEVTRFPRPASPLQDVATIIGSREMLSALLLLYDHQLEHEGTTGWDSLLPQLIEIVSRINVTSSTCVHEFSRFFWRFCRTFGKIFTNTKIKPQFQEILRLSEENVDASAGNGILTKATVPIYATGVLTCYNQEEDRKLLVGFLEDVMTTLSLSHAPLDSLKASFVELGANPVYHELLLTVLWYGVVHTSALVRCTAARMFEVILSSMIKECEIKVENRGIADAQGSMSIACSLVGEDAKTKFLSKMGQLTTSGAMLANVFQRKK
ncbi:hypothetical protein PAMP_011309 [Pampus punctatissimus]